LCCCSNTRPHAPRAAAPLPCPSGTVVVVVIVVAFLPLPLLLPQCNAEPKWEVSSREY
jgi:hypothetical protein